jgi:hypothetical protein
VRLLTASFMALRTVACTLRIRFGVSGRPACLVFVRKTRWRASIGVGLLMQGSPKAHGCVELLEVAVAEIGESDVTRRHGFRESSIWWRVSRGGALRNL